MSAHPAKEFVAHVVGDTEDVWDALFLAMGSPPYPRPVVVVFTAKTQSACGLVSAAVGPFYCLGDDRIYLDTAFLSEFSRRLGPPGDFARAYLIVYQISRHVQNALGTMQPVNATLSGVDDQQRSHLQIRSHLQADCYTGVWVHFVQERNLLEPGDLDEGVPFAQADGDAFARGTAAQRMWWFKRGLAKGDPRQCDTFAISQP